MARSTRESLAGILTVIAFAMTGCAAAGAGEFFPQYELEPPVQAPAAAIEGVVRVTDGCIFLGAGDELYLLLWPGDFALTNIGGMSAVADGQDRIVAEDGMRVMYGGGEYLPEHKAFVEGLISTEIPEDCATHRFWLVTEVQ